MAVTLDELRGFRLEMHLRHLEYLRAKHDCDKAEREYGKTHPSDPAPTNDERLAQVEEAIKELRAKIEGES